MSTAILGRRNRSLCSASSPGRSDRLAFDKLALDLDLAHAFVLVGGVVAIKQLPDGWTVVTKDRSLSAQWEYMVAVTERGFEVLTPWPDGYGDYAPITPGA